jgi:hypothetical protein
MKKPRSLPKPRTLAKAHRSPKPKATATPGKAGSTIASSSYDPGTGHLLVTFASGSRYRYEGVSPQTADDFRTASSQGAHLHAHIIGKHDASKL